MKSLGYTIVELIIVIMTVAIIAMIGIPMMNAVVDGWVFTGQYQNAGLVSAQVALDRMTRDIRRLKSDAYVTTATSSAYAFTDIDGTVITYDRSGTTLRRGVGASPAYDALCDNVTALTFTYYNDSDAVIATPVVNPSNTDIRYIKIDFAVSAGEASQNYSVKVRPQNLARAREILP